MTMPFVVGAAAVLAQASFSNTIGLGSVLVGFLILIGFAWASRKDKRAERWENLYQLADVERKEIQVKLEAAMHQVEDQKVIITKLDALQMPVKIVEMMATTARQIDEGSQTRLEGGLKKVNEAFTNQERRNEERHEAAMELMGELVKAVTQLSIKVEGR